MNIRPWRSLGCWLMVLAMCLAPAGCGFYEDGALTNDNPGNNNLNVVVAFGDSITQGSECSCTPYPARLTGLIGKLVYNTGVGGTEAKDNVGRTQQAIDRYHPAFMLILYGINDIIHSRGVGPTTSYIRQMVAICKQNNVVPVLATYPLPIRGHELFAFNTQVFNQNIRAIAEAEDIKCVDLEAEFTGTPDPANPAIGTDPDLMEQDGLHPNNAGTQIMTLAFADLF